jgi:putative flavoprotein involved in K+ transport
VFDRRGRVVHQRGLTESPGLYFLGLTWQHTRGSALIGWVGDDARYIAGAIEALAPSVARSRAAALIAAG